jgi:hypothetical protein
MSHVEVDDQATSGLQFGHVTRGEEIDVAMSDRRHVQRDRFESLDA